MRQRPLLPFAVSAVSFFLLLASTAAAAGENEPAPPQGTPIIPTPTPAPSPQVATPSQVATPIQVTTPTQVFAPSPGLTVVVPMADGGTVTAAGCTSVSTSGAPSETRVCPPAGPSVISPVDKPVRPRYAPDGTRTAFIIAAPIVYGLGAAVAGITYLSTNGDCNDSYYSSSSSSSSWGSYYSDRRQEKCDAARASLITYGIISSIVPSTPRLAVGDFGVAALYAGIRGGSILTAALVDWGKDDDLNWQGPFLLGFALPVTLAAIDMAKTPRREDFQSPPPAPASASIRSIAPIPISDREGRTRGGVLSLGGVF